MTHKYLSQIRTIPNYQDDQSDLAKSWRKAKYTFKAASNVIIKNKKTRIIASVLAIYMILTSGFVIAFVNVDNSQAKAQSLMPLPAKDLEVNIKKQRVESGNISLKLEVQNKTNQTIVNPLFQFQSSYNNIQWSTSYNDINNNKVDAQDSMFKLSSIGPSQKVTYSIYGKISNTNIENIAVTTKTSYFLENQNKELTSQKFLIDLK